MFSETKKSQSLPINYMSLFRSFLQAFHRFQCVGVCMMGFRDVGRLHRAVWCARVLSDASQAPQGGSMKNKQGNLNLTIKLPELLVNTSSLCSPLMSAAEWVRLFHLLLTDVRLTLVLTFFLNSFLICSFLPFGKRPQGLAHRSRLHLRH